MRDRVSVILILLLAFCFGFFTASFLVDKYQESRFEFSFSRFFSVENLFAESIEDEKAISFVNQEDEMPTCDMNPNEIVEELRAFWKPDLLEQMDLGSVDEEEDEEEPERLNNHETIIVQQTDSLVSYENRDIPSSVDSFGVTTKEQRDSIPARFSQKDQKTDMEVAQDILSRIMKYESASGRANTLQKELKSLPATLGSLGVLNRLIEILPQSLKGDALQFRKDLLSQV